MKLSKLVINKTRESQSLMVFEQRSYTQQLLTYTFQLVMKHYVFSLPKQHCPFRHLELKPLNAVIVKVHTLYKELTDPPQSRITRKWPYTSITAGSGHLRNGCKPERSFLSSQPSEYFFPQNWYSAKENRCGYKSFRRTVTATATLFSRIYHSAKRFGDRVSRSFRTLVG